MSAPSLTDLLLRDPQHPAVRRLLEDRYSAVCQQLRAVAAEKAQLEQVLRLAIGPTTHKPIDTVTQTR